MIIILAGFGVGVGLSIIIFIVFDDYYGGPPSYA